MAKVVIAFKREGKLHCDSCGYDSPHVVAFNPTIIGTPCPACEASLMTADDYQKTERLYGRLDMLNKWLGPIFGREESTADGERISVRIHEDEVHIRRNAKP